MTFSYFGLTFLQGSPTNTWFGMISRLVVAMASPGCDDLLISGEERPRWRLDCTRFRCGDPVRYNGLDTITALFAISHAPTNVTNKGRARDQHELGIIEGRVALRIQHMADPLCVGRVRQRYLPRWMIPGDNSDALLGHPA